MNILYGILLVLVLLLGVGMILFALPGTFIIVGATFLYGLATGFDPVSVKFIVSLLAVAIGLEVLEEVLGAAMARKFGGSKWAMVGAIAGGFMGAIYGTPLAPVVGTLLGGFIGAFLGAMLLEGLHTRDWSRAAQVGLGALFGSVGGKITKIVVAIVMVVFVLVKAF
ncbi:DUF456 domain-containing protein [bacterium]|nr:DUF456 domain-containing protein [bacterium]